MANTATIKRVGEDFTPDQKLREYLEGLSAEELRQLASYARKMAAGKEDPRRRPGGEGGQWLVAQYVHGSGPYFYLNTYQPASATYTNRQGRMVSGKSKNRYIGRRLPADVAQEFGYPEGATPEETDVHITGTPRHGSSSKKGSTE